MTIINEDNCLVDNSGIIGKFYKILAVILLAIGVTFCNLVFFACIKNSAHKMSIELSHIDNDLIEEERRLIMTKTSFDKTYNLEKLLQLAKDKLNLHFSDVRQIIDIEDILE